jgi:hypothetical protein
MTATHTHATFSVENADKGRTFTMALNAHLVERVVADLAPLLVEHVALPGLEVWTHADRTKQFSFGVVRRWRCSCQQG